MTVCRPRFATPRDLAFPTFGPEVAAIAARLGTPFMPWQLDLVDVLYEYDPVTGLLRYGSDDTTVPRQSGKTTLTLARKIHRMTAMSRRYGPQRATYTAQTRLAARKKLERDFATAIRASRSFREITSIRVRPTKATEWKLSTNNGSEHIQFGLGNFLQIDAPTETAGHGDTLDMGVIDEAFSQEDDAVEGAMRPAMSTRKNAQLSTLSTAGTSRSRFFYQRVLAGRAAAESGRHGSVCYVEYSAPDDADPADPATWWACMPALGHTVTEDFIRGEWERAQRKGPEGVDTFRRAYLNQWVDPPVLTEGGSHTVVDLGAWALLGVSSPAMKAPVLAVEVALDRSVATIGAAWMVNGRPHLEVVEERPGTDWVAGRCAELVRRYGGGPVVLDGGTGAAGLEPALTAAAVKSVVLTSPSRVAACGFFYDLAGAGGLTHNGDPAITAALAAAQWKNVGDGGRVFSRRQSGGDIAALYVVVLALHGLTTRPAAAGYRSMRERAEARARDRAAGT